ncbi:RNA polymerase sigma factor [Ottowia thiooxydans]|uniref:RNA polymerase sigma factor n=1 Tax=Ottowia thiooxydans TaxID=219182 RepID=UPI00146AA255|nr:RNA polymerase sigma factor [Ottowia thiooxydans]
MESPVGAGSADEQLAKLYQRWRGPLTRMLRRYFGTPAEAEDGAQEVFVRMAAAGKTLPEGDEQRYLRTTARNIAIDGWRKSAEREEIQVVSLEVQHQEVAVQGAGDSTLDQAERHQLIARLDQALEELPTRQREAFMLHRIEGHTVQETALLMGISTRMAVKHLSRGLAYCQARVMYVSIEQMRQLHTQEAGAENEEETETSPGGSQP